MQFHIILFSTVYLISSGLSFSIYFADKFAITISVFSFPSNRSSIINATSLAVCGEYEVIIFLSAAIGSFIFTFRPPANIVKSRKLHHFKTFTAKQ